MTRRNLIFGTAITVFPAQSRSSTTVEELPLIKKQHRNRNWTVLEIEPARWQMDLFLSGAAGALRNFTALEAYVKSKGRRVVVAMNGGMFEADGSPVGWCVA